MPAEIAPPLKMAQAKAAANRILPLTAILLAGSLVLSGNVQADQTPPRSYGGLPEVARNLFSAGLQQFGREETPASGLGPVFNAPSCATCHREPATAGSSATFVTRFGRERPGGDFDPMREHGGPVLEAHGIVTDTCSVPGEVVPPEATIVTHRDTPPLFGAGLIDAIPDRDILRFADPDDRNGDGISGRPNLVRLRVGRFGWKAQAATLRDFVANAYLNELGITSPDLPNEQPPQGVPVACDGAPDPEDDGSRIDAVTGFLLLLAPLPKSARLAQMRAGAVAFHRAGCASCHLTRLRSARSHPIAALRGRRVRLFSDLLLHDMGDALADGVAQGFATGNEFRTAPLWGVAQSAPYLHDGRAATLEEAVILHGGEATGSRELFLTLSPRAHDALVAYLRSL